MSIETVVLLFCGAVGVLVVAVVLLPFWLAGKDDESLEADGRTFAEVAGERTPEIVE